MNRRSIAVVLITDAPALLRAQNANLKADAYERSADCLTAACPAAMSTRDRINSPTMK